MKAPSITPGEWLQAAPDEPFIYALNQYGENRMTALIQPGHIDDTTRTTVAELAATARFLVASKKMADACLNMVTRYYGGQEFNETSLREVAQVCRQALLAAGYTK